MGMRPQTTTVAVREFVTVSQAATVLGSSGQHVRNLIGRRELPAIRDGRRYRVPIEALQRYVAERLV